MNLFLATGNRHKIEEITDILQEGLGDAFARVALLTVTSLPEHPRPEEDGQTFEENALKKARYYVDLSKTLTLADDSGLEVDALNGRPGILSSRYADTNPERITRLLNEMRETPEGHRQARFVCAAVLVYPQGWYSSRTGFCFGEIAFTPQGDHGFGYDPVFVLPELGKTMAELSMGEKNQVSHRSRAIREFLPLIEKLIDFRVENNDNKLIQLFDAAL